jgi:hypothetical protein
MLGRSTFFFLQPTRFAHNTSRECRPRLPVTGVILSKLDVYQELCNAATAVIAWVIHALILVPAGNEVADQGFSAPVL